jgi:hypothetical protein
MKALSPHDDACGIQVLLTIWSVALGCSLLLPAQKTNGVAHHGGFGLLIGLVVGGMPPWDSKAGPLLGLFGAIVGAVAGIIIGMVRGAEEASASEAAIRTEESRANANLESESANAGHPQSPAARDHASRDG